MSKNLDPYKKGHFKVTDGHKLYYERYGREGGHPIVHLHGGPGGGFSDRHKKLFDKRTQDVLLFDQRGAGRSKPFASLKANTTQHLVDDMNRMLDAFGINKVTLSGGSWGSTLGLVYAIQNPDRVKGMVFRGVYLGDEEANKYYLEGGIAAFYPEVWERFLSHVPPKQRKNPSAYYFKQMKSKNKKTRQTYCYEWARYETCIAFLKPRTDKQIDTMFKGFTFESLALLEAHYITRGCFLPKNYILKNAHKIAHIPTVLVHGRYDIICLPQQAHELASRLNKCKIHWVMDGHVFTSKDAVKKQKAAVAHLAKR